jgi:non-lysosomal glucosylceramidase
MDERLSEPGKAARSFNLGLIVKMLPFIIRMQRMLKKSAASGFDPINITNPINMGLAQGVPLGGMGGGSIGRGWRGDFRRWMMRPGKFFYKSVAADQFSLFVQRPGGPAQALALFPARPPQGDGALSAWNWAMDPACATYYGLFPRAWTTYENPLPGVRLTCRQVSPVIPNNYRETSFPEAVFVWTVENLGDQEATLGLMFTFQNGIGAPNDQAGQHFNMPFRLPTGTPGEEACGVALRHLHRQQKVVLAGQNSPAQLYEDPLTFAISAKAGEGLEVTYQTRFSTSSSGADVWDSFAQNGKLENLEDETPTSPGETIGGAVAVTFKLAPGASGEVIFSLAWDMPLARSGFGTPYYRRYTQFYGTEGNAAPVMARDALLAYPGWEEQIDAWQKPVLEDNNLPDWYRMALFNELYYLVDGGVLWGYPKDEARPAEDQLGSFGYLEGHEYRMVNTYDVHFYASWALAMLWPRLELSLTRSFAAAVLSEDPELRVMIMDGKKAPRKLAGAVPHDVGWYDEDPWKRINGYFMHDTNEWKDLNSKFVLQVYRDYMITHNQAIVDPDPQFLEDTWEAVSMAMERLLRHDHDGDGLIENAGLPDQTYDVWTVSGPSAYTGGLWLASLSAIAAIARLLGKNDQAARWQEIYEKGKKSYEMKLWNGRYYNYDSSRSHQHDSIMADQLAGQWYALACGLPDVVDRQHARSALKMVFDYNVMQLHKGTLGAINGMRPDGKIDHTSIQSQEVWTGTTYALAAAMLQAGLREEAFKTAEGIVKTTYYRTGYWFQTPEAWNEKTDFRALAYMRPLAIWAMQWELLKKQM